MVSGFNHIDLGTIDSVHYTLNQELFVAVKEMIKNDKPLICSFEHSELGKCTFVMNRIYNEGNATYVLSGHPLFVSSLTVTDEKAEFDIEFFD